MNKQLISVAAASAVTGFCLGFVTGRVTKKTEKISVKDSNAKYDSTAAKAEKAKPAPSKEEKDNVVPIKETETSEAGEEVEVVEEPVSQLDFDIDYRFQANVILQPKRSMAPKTVTVEAHLTKGQDGLQLSVPINNKQLDMFRALTRHSFQATFIRSCEHLQDQIEGAIKQFTTQAEIDALFKDIETSIEAKVDENNKLLIELKAFKEES